MATANFNIDNKALLVEDEQLECEEYPILGEFDRNTDSTELADYDFKWWKIVLKYGYYSGAIIDYIRINESLDIADSGYCYCETQRELFEWVRSDYGVPIKKLREICGKVGDMEIQYYLDEAMEKIADYLAEIEEKEVLSVMDKIKQKYGYKEITCVGRFSNGEALYEEVG